MRKIDKVANIIFKIIKHRIFPYLLLIVLSINYLHYQRTSLENERTLLRSIETLIRQELHMQSFNVNKVPDGLIIWRNGDEMSYDSTMIDVLKLQRYKIYNVGIYNKKENKVYNVKVPFYAIALFNLNQLFIKPKLKLKNKFL